MGGRGRLPPPPPPNPYPSAASSASRMVHPLRPRTRTTNLGTKSAMSQSCIWTISNRGTRMMCSMLVGEEGAVDEHVIKRIIAFIEEFGYESAKIVLKSDQESSVKSVMRDAPTMPEYFPEIF